MKAREIKEGIYWVGGIDSNIRNFHGYLTQKGTTYNAYLIIDEKVTLIDTTKESLSNELIERISSVIDPSKIDYIVSNHVEMDHSGCLPHIMDLAPQATIFTCDKGEQGLRRHFKNDWDFKTVKSGDSVSLGKRSLSFVTTPMVHWPDNMVAYLPEDKMLFSNDAFGQHFSSSERFDDECDLDIVMREAKKYFANIVLPYSKPVQNALAAVSSLDIEMILPSHGIIWRKNINKIIDQYNIWSSNKTDKKVTIVYDTMWKSTEIIANCVYDAFEEKGYKIAFCFLQNIHMSDVMTDIIDSEYIAVGSPTLNRDILPSVAGFLTYLRGLSPGGRKALVFGSYGWGDQTVPRISKYMEECDFEIVSANKFKYIPDSQELVEYKNDLINIIN